MPKLPLTHANERIDKNDLESIILFPRELSNLLDEYRFLDRQSRILQGFRVELPNQTQFPGRIIVHGGVAQQRNGQLVFDETQLNVSKTITLEGSSTTFYVEVEFTEIESDVDARAFWDPTVDQGNDTSGDALPDGQEFSANVATKKTPGWKVVTPISTTGFERDLPGTINSNKIPLVKLATDSSNEITGGANTNLSTEKAVSTMVEYFSTTQIRVKHPNLFVAGDSINVTDSSGTSASTITTVDYATGLLTIAAITAKAPGAIVRVTSSSSSDFIVEEGIGRYRRIEVDAAAPGHVVGHRDLFFQGDEVHGDILSRGHGTVSERSDVNLQSLKDHVDFLSAQLQELKWGIPDPHTAGNSADRNPPGLQAALPTTPRYYDRAAGVQGARTAAVTVGDGVNTWGDFNGTAVSVLQAAHDALPAGDGGRIVVKAGTYALTSNLNITNIGTVILDCEPNVIFSLQGGTIFVNTTGVFVMNGGEIQYSSSTLGMHVDTSAPVGFELVGVVFSDCQIKFDVIMPGVSSFRRCRWNGLTAATAAVPLIVVDTNGTLAGTFEDCDVAHSTSSALAGACFLGTAATIACDGLKFVDCFFGSLDSGIFTPTMRFGTDARNLTFQTCAFLDILAVVHVQVEGGFNVRMEDCRDLDNLAGLLHCIDVDDVKVIRCTGGNNGFSTLYFKDCDRILVKDNKFTTNSGISLSNKAVHIEASSDAEDILIQGNQFVGDAVNVNTVGIWIDIVAASIYYAKIKIADNSFRQIEVGMYFAHTVGTSGIFRDVVVSGNVLTDPGSISQKIGILGGSASKKQNFTISDNVVSDIDPSTAVAVGGDGRHGILLKGTNNEQVTITGNVITNIGNSSFRNGSAGISNAGGDRVVISNNIVRNLFGTIAYGIRAAAAEGIVDATINGNVVESINGDATPSVGIEFYGGVRVAITGNQISDITTTGQGYYIWFVNGTGRSCENLSITGNMMGGGPNDSYGIAIGSEEVQQVSITGNSIIFLSRGIFIAPNGGSPRLDHLTISGNTVNAIGSASTSYYGIYVTGSGAALVRSITIVGNSVTSNNRGAIGAGIYAAVIPRGLVIAQNVLEYTKIGGTHHGIYVTNCQQFQVIHNHITNILGDSQIWANIVSNTAFIIAFNTCDNDGGTTPTSIETSAAGTPGIVGLNMLDDTPSGSASHYNIAASGAALAAGGTQFIQY